MLGRVNSGPRVDGESHELSFSMIIPEDLPVGPSELRRCGGSSKWGALDRSSPGSTGQTLYRVVPVGLAELPPSWARVAAGLSQSGLVGLPRDLQYKPNTHIPVVGSVASSNSSTSVGYSPRAWTIDPLPLDLSTSLHTSHRPKQKRLARSEAWIVVP